jgi:hypothetical protein
LIDVPRLVSLHLQNCCSPHYTGERGEELRNEERGARRNKVKKFSQQQHQREPEETTHVVDQAARNAIQSAERAQERERPSKK